MIPLVTIAKVQQFKQVSNSINIAKFNETVLQAQMTELYPLLGEKLYFDLMNNIGNYTELLTGNTYTYQGITYTNVGLEAVIAHYWYAYHSFYGDQIDTAFGLREKLNNDVSKQVDTSMKKIMFELNCRYAYNLWLNVERYLVRTKNPLYICNTIQKNRNFRLSKIG